MIEFEPYGGEAPPWPPISENRGAMPLFRALVFTTLLTISESCYGGEGLLADFLVKTNGDSASASASAVSVPLDLLGSDPPPIVLSLCSWEYYCDDRGILAYLSFGIDSYARDIFDDIAIGLLQKSGLFVVVLLFVLGSIWRRLAN